MRPPSTQAQTPDDPWAAPIPEAVRRSGLSRSEIYRQISKKNIKAVKSGRTLLVLMDTVRAHLASLPPAIINIAGAQPKEKATAAGILCLHDPLHPLPGASFTFSRYIADVARLILDGAINRRDGDEMGIDTIDTLGAGAEDMTHAV